LSNSSVMLVLTENSWLYIGLTALMPEIICVQLRFSDNHLPDIIPEADNVFMVVDSRIIFQGEWSAFNALRMKRPDANTVWLMLERQAGSYQRKIVEAGFCPRKLTQPHCVWP